MSSPEMRIISLHSQKGGTGKTSIALMLALAALEKGLKPLLVDADLSGTSIKDSIHLTSVKPGQSISDYFRAPEPKHPLEYIATAQLENMATGNKHNISVLLGDGQHDTNLMPLVYKENHSQFLRSRIEDLIKALIKEGQINVIIFDNSPGDWGLGKAILAIARHGKLQTNSSAVFKGHSLLVSSLDLNDVVSCIRLRETEPADKPFIHIINRSTNTASIENNINAIGANLDEKGSLSNEAGYTSFAQILRAKKVQWVCAEDKEFSSSYHKHVRGIRIPENIQDLVKLLGWEV